MPKFFKTQYNYSLSDQCPARSGRTHLEEFFIERDPNTFDEVVKVKSKRNMYEMTQLSKPDDLYTLLEKTGVELSKIESARLAVEKADDIREDFSSMPRNSVEAFNIVARAQRSFDELPVDVKAEFDNSSAKMLKSLLDNSFDEKIKKFISVKETPLEKKEEKQNEK